MSLFQSACKEQIISLMIPFTKNILRAPDNLLIHCFYLSLQSVLKHDFFEVYIILISIETQIYGYL